MLVKKLLFILNQYTFVAFQFVMTFHFIKLNKFNYAINKPVSVKMFSQIYI